MAYGILKVDNITFDNGGSDQNVTVSGLYRATTSGVTLSGTIAATTVSGVTVIGSTTVSGATVTGTTANFTSGNFSNIISSAATMSGALIMANQQQVRFREAVGNGVNHIALQAPAIVSADQTITLPDQTGTVITTGDNGSVSSTMLATNLTISAAAGSASTPSITFTGDLNTGIYSPGADQLAISTGGTGQLFVDASGNVGIGAPNPSALLDLRGSTSTRINLGVTGAANRAFLDYTESGFLTTLDADGDIRFSPNNTEAVRITTAGNVGIGTSSPSSLLHTQSAGQNATNLVSTGGSVVLNMQCADTGSVTINAGGSTNPNKGRILYSDNSDFWGFYTTDTERMRLDSSGRLGLGTSSPETALDVRGAIQGGNGTIKGQISFSTRVEMGAASNHNLGFITNNTTQMLVDTSGRVGIGTTSPSGSLDITGTAPPLLFQSTSALSNYITHKHHSSGDIAYIGAGGGAATTAGTASDYAIRANLGALIFATNGNNERLRIDSSGNVGIGTTSPSYLLDVASSVLQVGNATDAFIQYKSSAGNWHVGAVNSNAYVFYSGTYGSGIERARIDSSGRLLVGTSSSLINGDAIQIATDSTNCLGLLSGRADTFGPRVDFAKARGTTTSPSNVSSDDQLGNLAFLGYHGSYVVGAKIDAYVDGTPGANDMPGRLVFSTTADGAAIPTERLRITSAGNVGIGTSAPGTNFHVVGTSLFNGTQSALCNSTTGSYMTFQHNGTSVGDIGTGNQIISGGATTDFALGARSTGSLIFVTNTTEQLRITSAGVLQIADAGDITVGTTTGTKIGTATTQKLGFYNATPVVQPTAVADATDAATVITQLNALLAKLRTLGIIAT